MTRLVVIVDGQRRDTYVNADPGQDEAKLTEDHAAYSVRVILKKTLQFGRPARPDTERMEHDA